MSIMPLESGSSHGAISSNISELRHSGDPEKQAIALHKAGKDPEMVDAILNAIFNPKAVEAFTPRTNTPTPTPN